MPGKWEKAESRTTDKRPDQPKQDEADTRSPTAPASQNAANKVVSFRAEHPRYGLDRVILPTHTKREIETVLAKVRHHQTLYEDWNLRSIDLTGGRTNINLYGPPGTGKTLCAEAIAHELDKLIIKVSYAEIESKYVGETPKNITAAFRTASKSDALIFFDEADSILGRRLSNVSQSADHGVNVSRSVMLLEMDSFSGVTVFASNFAENYDPAFTRRILAHVHIPLPDSPCREKLWLLHMPKEMPVDPRLDLERLVELSEGMSGADILNIVIQAASTAVRRTKPDKFVSLEDLEAAIRSVRDAKRVVGAGIGRRTWAEEVELEDAPEDVRLAARARIRKKKERSHHGEE